MSVIVAIVRNWICKHALFNIKQMNLHNIWPCCNLTSKIHQMKAAAVETRGDLWDEGSRVIHKGPSSTAFNIKYSFP